MLLNNLIYISALNVSVFDSQVVNFLNEIYYKKNFDEIILLVGVQNPRDYQENHIANLNKEIKICFYKQYPNYFFYTKLQELEFLRIFKMILKNNTVIHLRGSSLAGAIKKAYIKLKLRNIKVISNIRGAGTEEISFYMRKVYNPIEMFLKVNKSKNDLKKAVKQSDALSAVSETLKKYIVSKTGINSDKIYVNHCSAGKEFLYSVKKRYEIRNSLKIRSDEILFVFVTGGDGFYQNTKFILGKLLSHKFKILNLSKTKLDDAINLFVPHNEMSGYLCAADISVVWRDNNVVNNVASPVKFSEYACCGLPVIANDGVFLINDYLQKTGYGKTVKDFNDIDKNTVSNLLNINRDEISNFARSVFSVEKIAGDYMKIYKKLMNGNSIP